MNRDSGIDLACTKLEVDRHGLQNGDETEVNTLLEWTNGQIVQVARACRCIFDGVHNCQLNGVGIEACTRLYLMVVP